MKADLVAINQFRLLEARLYLQQFHLHGSSLLEERKTGILQLYKTASTMIARTISGFSDSNWFDLMAHAPLHMFRVLFAAASTLLKVLNSSYSQYVDFETGKLLFDSARFAIRRLSVQENDLVSRGAQLLHFYWTFSETSLAKEEEPGLLIESRLGASLMYDCLWRWRGKTGLHSNGKMVITSAAASGTPDDGISQPQYADSGPPQRGSAPHAALFPLYEPALSSIADEWTSFPNVDWLWDFELPHDPMTTTG